MRNYVHYVIAVEFFYLLFVTKSSKGICTNSPLTTRVYYKENLLIQFYFRHNMRILIFRRVPYVIFVVGLGDFVNVNVCMQCDIKGKSFGPFKKCNCTVSLHDIFIFNIIVSNSVLRFAHALSSSFEYIIIIIIVVATYCGLCYVYVSLSSRLFGKQKKKKKEKYLYATNYYITFRRRFYSIISEIRVHSLLLSVSAGYL